MRQNEKAFIVTFYWPPATGCAPLDAALSTCKLGFTGHLSCALIITQLDSEALRAHIQENIDCIYTYYPGTQGDILRKVIYISFSKKGPFTCRDGNFTHTMKADRGAAENMGADSQVDFKITRVEATKFQLVMDECERELSDRSYCAITRNCSTIVRNIVTTGDGISDENTLHSFRNLFLVTPYTVYATISDPSFQWTADGERARLLGT